jgi:hypothetical protein
MGRAIVTYGHQKRTRCRWRENVKWTYSCRVVGFEENVRSSSRMLALWLQMPGQRQEPQISSDLYTGDISWVRWTGSIFSMMWCLHWYASIALSLGNQFAYMRRLSGPMPIAQRLQCIWIMAHAFGSTIVFRTQRHPECITHTHIQSYTFHVR